MLPVHAILQLMGGVNLSFYDWYCDLPNAFPRSLGRTDGCVRKQQTGSSQNSLFPWEPTWG